MSTPTASAPSATHTGTGTGTGNANGSGKRDLLFFVALGFGVVFTNLWIIVGVKYCFRYNRRARALAALGADGENGEIDLSALNRPRRRRERKWMSMDEVNERFPLTKYKVWRATREHQGLPAAGGVTAPPSRAGSISARSIKTADKAGRPSISECQVVNSSEHIDTAAPRISISNRKDLAAISIKEEEEEEHHDASTNAHTHHSTQEKHETLEDVPLDETTHNHDHNHDDSDDQTDPIHAAAPMAMGEAGDACAICLDTLDDDDEVRGLTCGHAFHAGCLDPWLTSRRASCPLCKADYYIPKPRDPTTESGGPQQPTPMSPAAAWMGGRGFHPRQRTFVMGGRLATVNVDDLGYHDFRAIQVGSNPPPQRTGPSRRDRLADRLFGNPRRHLPFFGENRPARPSRNATVEQEQQSAQPVQTDTEVSGVLAQQGRNVTYMEPLGRALPNPGDLESGMGRGAGMYRGGMMGV